MITTNARHKFYQVFSPILKPAGTDLGITHALTYSN